MGEAFMLREVGPGAVRGDVSAGVGGVVDEVEEGDNLGEVGAEHRATGVMGAGVEHVDDVKGQEDTGLMGGVREVAVDEKVEEVSDGVQAAVDADAKLASGEEEGSEVRAEMGQEDGGGEAMPGCADAEGVEFEGVVGVFVESEEVVGAEEGSSRFGDGTCVDEGNGVNKGGEVGAVRRVVVGSVLGGAMSGEGTEEVDGVSERAGGSAAAGVGEGMEDK